MPDLLLTLLLFLEETYGVLWLFISLKCLWNTGIISKEVPISCRQCVNDSMLLCFPVLWWIYPPPWWNSPHCSLNPKGYRYWGWISKKPQPPRRQPTVPNVGYQMWSLSVGGAAINLHDSGSHSRHICMYIPVIIRVPVTSIWTLLFNILLVFVALSNLIHSI